MAPPDQVIAEYRAAGYDFLVLTDQYEERREVDGHGHHRRSRRRLHDAAGHRAQLGRLGRRERVLGQRDRAAARAIALTGIHSWRSDVVIGELVERATLDLGRLRSPYWRLTVTDADGRRAWTNPVWP